MSNIFKVIWLFYIQAIVLQGIGTSGAIPVQVENADERIPWLRIPHDTNFGVKNAVIGAILGWF